MNTIDNLTNPARRDITTVWTTSERVNEGTYDAGTVRVALTTHQNKHAKRYESHLNREVLTDSGFITRSFSLFAEPTLDAGITLATEPAPRFNAKKAAALHAYVLENLDLLLKFEDRNATLAAVFADMLEDARATV